ncbi:MAG: Gfo/Idh/MocA family oxidoreductase [Flavobacteriaceae bacterium]
MPPDASPDTVDFDTFLGNAPKVPYDPTRFFRWRNYQDYGTGVPGDMFVHAFSSLHYIIDSVGPTRAMAAGGLRYWKDGRDVPDIAIGLYDYPKTQTHPAFNASLRVNFIDGAGGGHGFRLVGTEGALEVGTDSVKLIRKKIGSGPGSYSMISFPEITQEKIRDEYAKKEIENRESLLKLGEIIFEAPEGYQGSHYDHTHNFIQAIRGNYKVIQDPSFGLRAAGAALLANESYFQKKMLNWDPQTMKLV